MALAPDRQRGARAALDALSRWFA